MARQRPVSLLCLAAVLALGPAASSEDEAAAAPLYGLRGGFGPSGVSFPWHAAFSPDGKWVGFSDGYAGYVEVWDVATGTRAWPSEPSRTGATHRIAFSADSRRVAFVAKELRLLRLESGAWREDRAVPLGFSSGIYASWSPLRLDLAPDASSAVLTAEGRAWRVDVAAGRVEPVSGDADDVIATFLLPDGRIAYSRSRAFSTRVLAKDGTTKDVPGVLLEASPDGTRWLVATDPKRFDLGFLKEDEDSRLALEIRDAGARTTLGAFVLSGRRKPGDGSGHRLLLQGAFSRDGRLLATVEGTGDVVLRDSRTGAPLQRIREYAGQPYPMGVAFSPDGTAMVTGGRRRDGPEVLMWSRAR